jgi:hypothetical protein
MNLPTKMRHKKRGELEIGFSSQAKSLANESGSGVVMRDSEICVRCGWPRWMHWTKLQRHTFMGKRSPRRD